MNRRRNSVGSVLLTLVLTVPCLAAIAQSPEEEKLPDPVIMLLPGAARPGADPLRLLQNPQVQKELALSTRQIEQLAQLNEQTRSRVRSLGRTRGGPQVPPPVGAVRGFEAEQQQANQDARQKVAEILNPEQLEGFKQIIQSQPGADPLQLLVSDQVQQALGLSEDQVDQLRQIGDKARANTGSRSRSAATGSQAIAAARTQLDQQTRGARQQVAEILTPQQLQRLRQILVQVDGTALADPDLSDSLGLSPEQQRQLVTNQAEKFERIGSGFKAVRTRSGDPKAQCAAIVANRNQLDPILQQNRERTRGVLTPQQLAVLKQLEGQPLALDPPSCPAEVR